MPTSTFTVLRSVLDCDSLADRQILELPQQHVQEDLWLDYKRGQELEKPKRERAADLRRWISGFANAGGGLLLLGIAGGEGDDSGDRWRVTGCDPGHVGGSLSEWASRCLTPLAAYLSPPPIIREIPHENGPILAIAVDRAPNLVPVVEGGVLAYYLRIGDQTLRIDPYLHSDLVLGRRRAPQLTLSAELEPLANLRRTGPTFEIRFRFENSGLVWVPRFQFVVVAYVARHRSPDNPPFVGTSDAVRREVHVRPMGTDLKQHVHLQMAAHEIWPEKGLPPLQWGVWRYRVPYPAMPDPVRWLGAVCLLPSNGLPQWCQLSVTLAGNTIAPQLSTGVPFCQPVAPGTQPQIAYGNLEEVEDWLADA